MLLKVEEYYVTVGTLSLKLLSTGNPARISILCVRIAACASLCRVCQIMSVESLHVCYNYGAPTKMRGKLAHTLGPGTVSIVCPSHPDSHPPNTSISYLHDRNIHNGEFE